MLHLNLLLVLSLLGPAETDTTYRQYEKENVSQFRRKFDFTMPKVALGEEDTPVISRNNYSDPSDTIKSSWELPACLDHLSDIHRPSGPVKIDGYRVQLYAGTSYETAKKMKADFVLAYSDYTIYDKWESPHFRVRAGDFLSYNEAITFKNMIKEKFPGAFVVPDKIEIKRRPKNLNDPGEVPVPPGE